MSLVPTLTLTLTLRNGIVINELVAQLSALTVARRPSSVLPMAGGGGQVVDSSSSAPAHSPSPFPLPLPPWPRDRPRLSCPPHLPPAAPAMTAPVIVIF